MPIAPPADRAVYHNSGRVRLMSLVWGAVMGTSLSLLVSAAMMGLSMVGFYIIGLVPMAAGMAVGGLAMLVVYQSHCRNWMLAGALGFCMGVLGYLGYYHLDMLRHVGFDNWHRVDATPAYIQIRWENDTIGKPGRQGGAPNYWVNVILSFGECAAMAAFGAILAMRAGEKPYAETAQCWMNKSKFKCPAGSSAAITQALTNRSTTELAAAMTPSLSDDPGFNQCEFWSCPPHRDPEGAEPVYLSMTEHGPANKDGNRAEVQAIVYWQLEPAEVTVAAKAFPNEIGIGVGEVDNAEGTGPDASSPDETSETA
jgi:hypothetical protein